MSEAERKSINARIDSAWRSAGKGKIRPAAALLAELRERRTK